LYYYGARWYDSALARFLSPDSLIPDPANSLDWDRYQYARSNPLKFSDPSGHSPVCGHKYSDSECRKSSAPVIIWTQLPVEDTEWIQYFGNTEWAYKHAKEMNYDSFAQGMHPGMDYFNEQESVPVYAGVYGYIDVYSSNPEYYRPGWVNLKVHNGERYVTAKYGHLLID
jgi:hypothetical protein